MLIKPALFSVFILITVFLFSCEAKKKSSSEIADEEVSETQQAVKTFNDSRLENLNLSRQLKDIICQCWDYKSDIAALDAEPVESSLDIVLRGYCFFRDGSMIKNPRGELSMGKWDLDTTQKPIVVNIQLNNGEKEKFFIAYLMPYRLVLADRKEGRKLLTEMSSEAFRHLDDEQDPFYKKNIAWRIKPSSPESTEEIKQRLKACLHFFTLFYDRHIFSEQSTINFGGLPSCFRWYSGGIYLQKKEVLSRQWIRCFYNEEQAMKAYAMADELLSKKYNWPKNEPNWLGKNVAVLRQMEAKLDSLNF